jgi:serine/threonine protein phosphatase PrpC
MLAIAIATRSERGQRTRNEDSVRVCREGAQWLAILADGAGGHQGGAEASRRAVAYVDQALHAAGHAFDAGALTRAVVATHRHVLAGQRSGSGLDHMHSTVVVLWIDGASGGALWTHVGDSRLYVVRRGVLRLLTSDDSVVQRMVDAGLLTPQQALVHPNKSQLVSALGIDDDIEPHTVAQAVRWNRATPSSCAATAGGVRWTSPSSCAACPMPTRRRSGWMPCSGASRRRPSRARTTSAPSPRGSASARRRPAAPA